MVGGPVNEADKQNSKTNTIQLDDSTTQKQKSFE